MEDSKTSNIQEKLKFAAQLYLHTDYTLAAIAAKVGLSKNTLTKYKKEEGWDDLRTAHRVQGPKLISRLYEEINSILDGTTDKLTSKQADAVSKLTKSINDLQQGPSAAQVIQVMTGFTNFVAAKGSKEANQVLNYCNDYIASLASGGGHG